VQGMIYNRRENKQYAKRKSNYLQHLYAASITVAKSFHSGGNSIDLAGIEKRKIQW
jgi:hypothetical protein